MGGGGGEGYGRARSSFDLSQYLQSYFVYLVYLSGEGFGQARRSLRWSKCH